MYIIKALHCIVMSSNNNAPTIGMHMINDQKCLQTKTTYYLTTSKSSLKKNENIRNLIKLQKNGVHRALKTPNPLTYVAKLVNSDY